MLLGKNNTESIAWTFYILDFSVFLSLFNHLGSGTMLFLYDLINEGSH